MARLSLIVDPTGAERGYRRAGDAADKFKSQASGSVRATNQITGAFDRLTRSVFSLRGLLAGAGAGLITRQVIQAFSDFERQLIEVGKTTDLQGEQLDALGERIQDIASRVPVATSRLQSLAVAAGQLGVTGVDNVAAFTETLGKLETATDIAGEEGARSLARLLNITGESNDQISNLGSAITALGNQFATTEEEISRTSTFLASATGQFGVSAQEVLGLSAALRALGQRAETSGSSVGAALGSINTAVAEGGETLRMLADLTGTTMEQFRRRFQEDATGALLDFADALGDVPAAQQTQILEDLGLAGRETSRVINALARDTDMVRAAVVTANEEWERNEALNIEAARAAESFSAQMQFLSNALNEAAVDIGRELAPVILDLTRDFRDWIQTASDTGQLSRIFEDVAESARFMADNFDKAVIAGSALVGLRIGAVFGPWGALIGAAAGALGAFALASDDTTEATRSYNEAMEANSRLQQALERGSSGLVEQRKAEAKAAREAAIAENELLLSRRESMQAGLELSDPGLPRGFAETFAGMSQAQQQAFLASENITNQTKMTLRQYVRVGEQIDDTKDKLRELRGAQVMIESGAGEMMQPLVDQMGEILTLQDAINRQQSGGGQTPQQPDQDGGVRNLDLARGAAPNISDRSIDFEAQLYGTDALREQRAQELEEFRTAQEQKLEQVEQYLMSREDQEIAAYERRQEIIRQSVDDEQKRQQMLEDLEDKHQKNLTEINQRGVDARRQAEMSAQSSLYQQYMTFLNNMEVAEGASWDTRLNIMTDSLATMSQTGAQYSREAFEVNKTAATANALVSTYQGIAKALEWGWPMGPVFAALIAAQGFMQVRAIQSQSFQGGGGGTAPSQAPSGGGPSNPAVPQNFVQQPQGQGGGGGGARIEVHLNGNISTRNERELAETIKEVLKEDINEGDFVMINANSRQAREISGRAA